MILLNFPHSDIFTDVLTHGCFTTFHSNLCPEEEQLFDSNRPQPVLLDLTYLLGAKMSIRIKKHVQIGCFKLLSTIYVVYPSSQALFLAIYSARLKKEKLISV